MLVEILYKEIESTDQLLGVKNYRKANLGFVTEVGSLLHLKCLEDSGMKSKIEEGKFFWPKKYIAANWKNFNDQYWEKSKAISMKMLANAQVPTKRGKSFISELQMKNSAFGGMTEQGLMDALDNFNSPALNPVSFVLAKILGG